MNRLRFLKRQLNDLPKRLGDRNKALGEEAKALVGKLEAVEAVLIDIKRETPRDVLRNPAGLNDSLLKAISLVAIADAAPTVQARQVAEELLAKVDAQIGRLNAINQSDVGALNDALRSANVEVLGVAT